MNVHKNNSGEKQELSLFLPVIGSSLLHAECVTNPLTAEALVVWLVGLLRIFLRGLTLNTLPIAGVHTLTDDLYKTGTGLATEGLLKSSGERFSFAVDDAQSFL